VLARILSRTGVNLKAIEDSLVLITAEDAHGFFQKAKNHYSLCRALPLVPSGDIS